MKRAAVLVMVLVVSLALSGLGMAAEKKAEKKPDATLKLTEGQVALGIGWSWGKGELNYKGKKYAFKVDGITVGDIGVTKAEAEGKVYNLKKLSDIEGSFTSAGAEATLGLGAGATAMKNDAGVVIHLFPKTKGANLKLAGGGVKITLEKTK
jgi:hypothetical protein